MKARIPKHREFIINFPDSIDNAKANEGWAKLQQIVEDYIRNQLLMTPDRVPLEKAYEMVMRGEIKDGKTIAGILKLKALLAEGKL